MEVDQQVKCHLSYVGSNLNVLDAAGHRIRSLWALHGYKQI